MRHPSYEEAIAEFVDDIVGGLAKADDFLSRFEFHFTERTGPLRVLHEGKSIDVKMSSMSATSSTSFEAVRNCDVQAITTSLYELAQARIGAISRSAFSAFDTVTESTGMTFDARGRPFSHDLLLEMLERIEVSFEGDGAPNLALVVPPGALNNLPEPTIEQRERFDQIMSEKRRAYDASKRHRRLS